MAEHHDLRFLGATAKQGAGGKNLFCHAFAARSTPADGPPIWQGWRRVGLLLCGILLCSACSRQEPQYQGKPLSFWKVQTQAKEPKVRLAAIEPLSEMGRAGVPALVELLRDTDRQIRKRAVQALVEMRVGATNEISDWATGNKDGLEILAELCREDTQEGYFIALAETGVDAVPLFEQFILGKDRRIARLAAEALEEMVPTEAAIPILKKAVKKSPHREVRERAAESLRACQQVE